MTLFITTLTALLVLLFAASGTAFAQGHARTGARLLWLSWGGALLLLGCNAVLAGAPPFGNMRHVLCFFPLVLAPAWYYLRRTGQADLGASFAWAAVPALIGALCMPMQAGWRQMPALQSPWFVPHVTSYIIAYGLLTVSAFQALRGGEARLTAAHAVVNLAFPFLTFGLWSGSIWADAAWGRYWAWDIKEVWSLITWGIYIIYFHSATARPEWRRLLLLAGFVAVVITFLVVNLLPKISSLHSYAS